MPTKSGGSHPELGEGDPEGRTASEEAWVGLALAQGDIARLDAWAASVSRTRPDDDPVGCAVRAWVLFAQGLGSDARRWLTRAESALSGSPEMAGLVFSVRTYFALYEGRNAEAVASGDAALEGLDEGRFGLRAWVLSLQSVAHLILGDQDASLRASAEARAWGERAGVDLLSPVLYAGWQRMQCGDLTGAERSYRHGLLLASPEGMEPLPAAALVHTMLSGTSYERDGRAEALRHAQRALEIGERHGDVQARVGALVMRARVDAAEGALHSALELATEAARLAVGLESCRALPDTVVAELQARLGDWESGLAWIAALDAPGSPPVAPAIRDLQVIAAARVLLAAGRSCEAVERLRPAVEATRRAPGGLTVALLATWAKVRLEVGEEDEAVGALGDAVRRAGVHGHIRSIVDAGPELVTLMGRLRVGSGADGPTASESGHLRRIETAFMQGPRRGPQPRVAPPPDFGSGPRPEPRPHLTPREHEVLLLLAEGLSNKQIAARLGTRIGTVKKQVSAVLWKTRARNRTHAVARARSLDLIGTEG